MAADALTVLPFGNHDYVLALHRSPIEVAGLWLLLVVGLAGGCRPGAPTPATHEPGLGEPAPPWGPGRLGVAHPRRRAGVPLLCPVARLVPLAVLLAIGVGLVGDQPTGGSRRNAVVRQGAGPDVPGVDDPGRPARCAWSLRS